jgi:hypothetical protein
MDALQSLAPNVAIVVCFIWYLVKKDKMQETIFADLSKRLEALADVIASLEGRLKSIEITRVGDRKKDMQAREN